MFSSSRHSPGGLEWGSLLSVTVLFIAPLVMIRERKSGQNLQQKRENLGDDLLARIFQRQLHFLPARFGGALLFRPQQRLQQLLQTLAVFQTTTVREFTG